MIILHVDSMLQMKMHQTAYDSLFVINILVTGQHLALELF